MEVEEAQSFNLEAVKVNKNLSSIVLPKEVRRIHKDIFCSSIAESVEVESQGQSPCCCSLSHSPVGSPLSTLR